MKESCLSTEPVEYVRVLFPASLVVCEALRLRLGSLVKLASEDLRNQSIRGTGGVYGTHTFVHCVK